MSAPDIQFGLIVVLVSAALVLAPRIAVSDAPEGHDIKLAASDVAQVGMTRSLSLTIATRSGYTISRDGPLYIDLTDADAEPRIIELPKQRYQRSDAADVHADAPRFDLRYRARAPGQTTMHVALFFWVCGARICWPVRESRDVRIDVHAVTKPSRAVQTQGAGGPGRRSVQEYSSA